MKRPTLVAVIAVIEIIGGILTIVSGVLLLWLFNLFGAISYGILFNLLSTLGVFLLIVSCIFGILDFITAWGLLAGKGWAWTLALILSAIEIVFSLFSIPDSLGTLAASGATIALLFQPTVKSFFGKGPAYQPPATYQASQAPQATPPPPEGSGQKVPVCPKCGQPLTWIGQYQRWYCYYCQQYAISVE